MCVKVHTTWMMNIIIVYITASLVALLSVYLYWPPQLLPTELTAWKNEKSSRFTVKGKTLFYKDEVGQGMVRNEPLLLIHGFPTMSYDWIKIWTPLVKSFNRVVAPDLLGFGFSDKPQNYNYSIMEQADLIQMLVRAIGIDSVTILAHDYGDSVAQELLARQNERKLPFKISNLCLTNGGIFVATNNPRPIQRLLTVPYIGSWVAKMSSRFIYGKGLSDIFGPKTKPSDRDLDIFWAGWREKDGYLNSASILGYIAERGRNDERWTRCLQESFVPVHMIYGPADPVNPPYFIEYFKKTVPHASLKVLDEHIGHYVQWEDPDSVLQSFLQFIREQN